MRGFDAEQLTEPAAFHGEGPVWSADWGELRYVDMLAGDVHSVDSTGHITICHISDVVAAIRPRQGGGMVAAVERGFALVADDGKVTEMPELWSNAGVRMNDGGCDPEGRFYCGSMAYDMSKGAGSLYRLDSDHSVAVVLEGVTISNGLDWSPDHGAVYFADTATQQIDVFSYSPEHGFGERRQFVRIEEADGAPDGITVDSDGCVWVALWGGGAVRRYRPDGRLDGVIELPVSQVTACTFGGARLDELFITTSRQGVGGTQQPAAGAVFRSLPGTRGRPVLPFRG